MILIKGFFRKLSTKIYLVIFIILLTTIITMFSFTNYYNELFNQIYRKNSYMLVTSKVDYYDKLKSIKNIVSIEEVLLFEPDKKYDVIIDEDYVVIKNGVVVETKDNGGANKMNWENFMIRGENGNKFLIVSPSKRNSIELKDDEIALSLDSFTSSKIDIAQAIIGEKIGFYHKKIQTEYTIKEFYQTEIPGMLVSNNVFQTLTKDKDIYSYLIKPNGQKNAYSIKKNLKKSNDIIEVFLRHGYSDKNDGKLSIKLIDAIDILDLISKIIILIFIIIFIIVITNIIKDSKKNINLERKLGYNVRQIRYYLFLKLIILSGISLIISTFLSIIINYVINYYYQFQLILFDIDLSGTLYISILISTVLASFLTKIEKYKV